MEITPRFYRGKENSFSMSKTSYCGILAKVWRPHYQSNRRFYADKERRKKRDKKHITFKIPLRYHIAFAPKYRRKEIYGQLKNYIGEILLRGYGQTTSLLVVMINSVL